MSFEYYEYIIFRSSFFIWGNTRTLDNWTKIAENLDFEREKVDLYREKLDGQVDDNLFFS